MRFLVLMLGIFESLFADHGFEDGSLTDDRWAGDTGLWLEVKELCLLRVKNDLLLGCLLLLLLLESLLFLF